MNQTSTRREPARWWETARESVRGLVGDLPPSIRFFVPDIVLVGALLLLTFLLSMGLGSHFLILGLLQIVPLVFRRVAPLYAALVIAAGCLLQLALMFGPHFANVAVPIVVYSAAVFGTRRASRLVLAIALVGAFLAGVDWTYGFAEGWTLVFQIGFATFFLAMFVTVAWVLGDVVRRRKEVVQRLEAQNRALARDQAQRAKLAAQGERASIAREMHDVVAHSLAVVVVQADGALYAARAALEQPPGITADRAALERAAATLETLAETARGSLAETRKLVGVLREEGTGAEYSPLQGLEHLEDLAQRVRDSGREVHLALRGRVDDLPREVDLAAYRVVQESLTNALKHAGPDASVDVDVLRTPAVLLVRVTDDGLGLAPDSDGEGNGILGMAERVEVLGGTVQAGPRPRGGWEVVATLPVTADAAGGPTGAEQARPGAQQPPAGAEQHPGPRAGRTVAQERRRRIPSEQATTPGGHQ